MPRRPSPVRFDNCLAKRRFDRARHAKLAAKRQPHRDLVPYLCPICDGWHLRSSRQ